MAKPQKLTLAQLLSGSVDSAAKPADDTKIDIVKYCPAYDPTKPIEIGKTEAERRKWIYDFVMRMANDGCTPKQIREGLTKLFGAKDAPNFYNDVENQFKLEQTLAIHQDTRFYSVSDDKMRRKLLTAFLKQEDALIDGKTVIPLVLIFSPLNTDCTYAEDEAVQKAMEEQKIKKLHPFEALKNGEIFNIIKMWQRNNELKQIASTAMKSNKNVPKEVEFELTLLAEKFHNLNAAMHTRRDQVIKEVHDKFNKSERGRSAGSNRYASLNAVLYTDK